MPADQYRRDRFNSLTDFASGVGLEFGPLDRPIALKSEHAVHYLDVFDTDGIREHYLHDPAIDTDELVDIDFWLQGPDGEMRDLVDVVGSAAPFRWVVASHVIEHVPDLIGWLSDIAEILEDGGTLVLAVPDRRYTFDALRPPTTVGQVLQAHEDRDAVPSIRAVYDHFRTVVGANTGEIWAGTMPTENHRAHDLEGTMAQVEIAREKGRYVDCHVWVFNPAEFVEQMVELGRLNLVKFTVDRVIPTAFNELEFYVTLTRTPRHGSTSTDDAEVLRDGEKSAALIAELRSMPSTVASTASPATAETQLSVARQDDGAAEYPVSAKEIRLIEKKRRVMSAVRRWRLRA